MANEITNANIRSMGVPLKKVRKIELLVIKQEKLLNEKGVSKGDGKEIDHKKPLSKGGSNAKSNQRVVSRSTNRKKGNK